ncbi:thiol reductant ABC exporter subunit CydD [Dermabacter vaginalis]|uniref:thiol reductant ABC exporter subunit CydD n=1 Tax=Dermabacter vaginalis TaxID=1630135 RepID=UPI001EF6020F|nr:thiol reductant ABC exporter subunit CydD [Dermabacter vaginalis]MCG7442817.1 thiol reductant ABC exporter subunit CydD [Dermabacter vaginalis]
MIRTVVLGLVEAVCAITTAWCVASLGADLLAERTWPHENPLPLAILAAALLMRAAAVWYTQATGHRAATDTIGELRRAVVEKNAALGPRGRSGEAASTAALATAGLENLRPYLTGYVPQLALSATVTPLALLAIAVWDVTSAIVACIALPLIPIFMILIGKMTEGSSARSLATMRTLWAETLDLVEGLPTLRALGRAKGSERIVADLGERHKKSAMTTLAWAFLSSFALELIATIGVALIAVSIGLRLVSGGMELFPGIAVLVLAAEVYLPLRLVGQQFHASTDGLAAVDAAFEVLNTTAAIEAETTGTPRLRPAPDLAHTSIVLDDLSVVGRDRLAPAHLTCTIRPGEITALRGASGEGKSTTIAAILGLLAPTSGAVTLRTAQGETMALNTIDRESMWAQVAWLPQRPVVGPGSLREILEHALPTDADTTSRGAQKLLEQAAHATGLDAHVIDVHGWDVELGRGGTGLSVGQRQRVALTAALLEAKPLVILDEPTSHLDGASEAMIVRLLETLREGGSSVLVTAHRQALLDIADQVIDVRAGEVVAS